jgi:glucose-6-phosphate-specific signal transduction histidine kinase
VRRLLPGQAEGWVDLLLGRISDADTGDMVEARAARVLAERLISTAREARRRVIREIDAGCGAHGN